MAGVFQSNTCQYRPVQSFLRANLAVIYSFLLFTQQIKVDSKIKENTFIVCVYTKIHVECWRCERLRNKRRKLNANLITKNIENENNKCTYSEKTIQKKQFKNMNLYILTMKDYVKSLRLLHARQTQTRRLDGIRNVV